MGDADVFEHADRDDAVVVVGFLAIIEQLEAHAVGKAVLERAPTGHRVLFLRQRHAGHVDAELLAEEEAHAAPARADVEDAQTGFQQELGGDVVLLVDLGLLQRLVVGLEVGTGILAVAVEEELEVLTSGGPRAAVGAPEDGEGTEQLRCAVEPSFALRLAVRVGQAEEVGAILDMIERDQPIGEGEGCVRQRRAVDERAAAVALQLVPEVPNVAAVEVEGDVVRDSGQAKQLAPEVVEDRLTVDFGRLSAHDGYFLRGHVVVDLCAEGPGAASHEREARLGGVEPAGVEPECMPVLGVQVDEDELRVEWTVELPHRECQGIGVLRE